MASPQLENGYTRIANEILEQLSRVQMSGTEWQFVMCLFRKTYGYNKTEDWITGSQIVTTTGMKKERVSEAKKRLLERQIVTEKRNKISFQKDWEKWNELRKSVTGVTEKRNKVLRKSVNTKERKKITKDISEADASAENNMPFNKYADDHEEGVIDLDGDGTLKEVKKAPTKKYPHAPTIQKLFLEILGLNPSNWRINKTQLLACENLYTERTPEKVRSALEFFKEHKHEEYCPQITSPYDLDSKWTKLGEYKLKL